jgi:hypothetical protein
MGVQKFMAGHVQGDGWVPEQTPQEKTLLKK